MVRAALLLFLLPISLCASAKTDNDQPIKIQSDQGEYLYHENKAIHRGHVVMSQGTRQILSDELTVVRNSHGQISTMIATGAPAKYRLQPSEDEPVVEGTAREIYYYLSKGTITLKGDAHLKRKQDVVDSEKIVYNVLEETIESNPTEKGRTTIVLQPASITGQDAE